MTTNRNESYLATARTRIDKDFWNGVVRDLAARISTLEGVLPEVDSLLTVARSLAVQRVNTALADYVAMIEGIADIGAIQTVMATGMATIGPGEKVLTVRLTDRDLIGNTGYVVVRPITGGEAKMAGPIVGYSAMSGELRFEVMNAVGDGTEDAWVVAYAKTVVEGPPGPAPAHEWDGTVLRFKNPDGSWGAGVDLEGEVGPAGTLDEASRASEAEAQAGSNNTRWMSPLRTAQAIAAQGGFVADSAVTYAKMHSDAIATAANYRAKDADKLLSTDVWDAMASVSLTDAGTITWDMSGGIDFHVSLAGNRSLGNPSNTTVGKKGRIKATASGGARTLGKSSNIKSADSITWPIEIASGKKAYLYYDVDDSSNVIITGVVNDPA